MDSKRMRSSTVPANADESEAFCRVCLEDNQTGRLIKPCICEGTMKTVHLHCLKTWVLAKFSKLENAHCEICNTQYSVEWKLRTECLCLEQLKKDLWSVLLIPFLLLLELVAILCVFFLSQEIELSESMKTTGLLSAALFFSCVAAILFQVAAVCLVRRICFGKRIAITKIRDYHKANEPALSEEMPDLMLGTEFDEEMVIQGAKVRRYPSAIVSNQEDRRFLQRSASVFTTINLNSST